jgi:hypothetical protein
MLSRSPSTAPVSRFLGDLAVAVGPLRRVADEHAIACGLGGLLGRGDDFREERIRDVRQRDEHLAAAILP